MAGANPQRTSWVPEEVKGDLSPVWYRPIEPYISQNVQIIAAEGKLFVSTARGLYALNAANGDIEWIYPTELPLGHSPTYHNGVLYVGGFDRRLHAINASNGTRLWTFDAAKAGYRTNPLVVNDLVLLGNRDGWFYAIHAHGTPNQGQLAWKYKTDGPINYSAAYKDGVVFFASQDMHAYALYLNGTLKWKSEKLHGAGFHSWWPVIWRDKIIFVTVANYRFDQDPGAASCDVYYPPEHWNAGHIIEYYHEVEGTEIQSSGLEYIEGTEPGDWVAGTKTYDASPTTQYFEKYPWRRSHYFLDINTGADWGFDYDGDGNPEYAPIAKTGTHNGVHPPPMVSGFDNVLYQQNNYRMKSDGVVLYGQIAGWKMGTPFISQITNDPAAWDEPHIASGGGSMVYWSLCCDREAGGMDISRPLSDTSPRRDWKYYNYDLPSKAPGYDEMWLIPEKCGVGKENRLCGYYSSINGIYHNHTNDQNPWVPYNGHLYIHRSNAIFSFGPEGGGQKLPLAEIQQPPQETYRTFSTTELKQMLADEIQKWVDAGHLHPGWFNGSQFGSRYRTLNDYFQNPGENIWTLLRALPHLPAALQQATRDLIQSEYNAYPPTSISSIGWNAGVTRNWFLYPPEVRADLQNFSPGAAVLPHMNVYALWKYAQEFGGATAIYNAVKNRLDVASYSTNDPYRTNAAIAGYWGYLELEKLAGEPESTSKRETLNSMLAFRADNFSKDTPYPDPNNTQVNMVNISRNFIYMTPELGQYLHDHALSKVQEAVEEYNYLGPYWFVSRYEGCLQECTIQNLNDAWMFQGKAWILQESREELLKYLDVPAFMRGDLFYIHNLISAIEAQPAAALDGDVNGDCRVDIADIMLVTSRWGTSCDNPDPDNDSDTPNYEAHYDLDDDCDIDLEDMILVAAHWGNAC